MSVQVDEVCFSEDSMDAGCIGLLGVFIGIKAYKNSLMISVPVLDMLNKIVYKLVMRIR